jgi:hypothetical protein
MPGDGGSAGSPSGQCKVALANRPAFTTHSSWTADDAVARPPSSEVVTLRQVVQQAGTGRLPSE